MLNYMDKFPHSTSIFYSDDNVIIRTITTTTTTTTTTITHTFVPSLWSPLGHEASEFLNDLGPRDIPLIVFPICKFRNGK